MKHVCCVAAVVLLLVSGFVSVALAFVPVADALRAVYISPDGKRIITTTLYARLTRIWDAETGKELARVNSDASVAFSSDGTKFTQLRGNNEVEVLETESGKSLQIFKGHTAPLASATFSHDGKKIVSASEDGTVRIWDVDTGKELLKIDGHIENPSDIDKDGRVNFSDRVRFAVFSPDGKTIVTFGNRLNDAQIWDAETDSANFGKELRKLEEIPFAMNAAQVAFSPDSKKIAIWHSLAIRIWDAESGKELQKLAEGQGHTRVRTIAFSPDGKKIVTVGDGDPTITNENYRQYITARIWDTESGKELHKLEIYAPERRIDHPMTMYNIPAAAFLPDGKRIITTYGNDIRIWDAESGEQLQKIELQGLYRER
ncbi:MAG: WD40 repeat domain-containing protein [Planctomycetaceae bacterium]|nr:WD40 repeat domain-containing protein [Planctomycetaceae bacterium]